MHTIDKGIKPYVIKVIALHL